MPPRPRRPGAAGAPRLTAVLDNEALQALANPAHPKHRRMIAVLEARTQRNQRRPAHVEILTTTAVRVEALMDRRRPETAHVNALHVRDIALDAVRADRAAGLRHLAAGLHASSSVVDATVAEAAATESGAGAAAAIYTADLTDLPALIAASGHPVRIIRV